MFQIECNVENAHQLWDWIQNRGGVAAWASLDLGNPGQQMLTPATTDDGSAMSRPHWSVANDPEVVTDPEQVGVIFSEECKRFRVGLQRGSGFRTNVTDAATRKIWAAVEKAGEGAFHVFDYDTQEAVIMRRVRTIPLTEWASTR